MRAPACGTAANLARDAVRLIYRGRNHQRAHDKISVAVLTADGPVAQLGERIVRNDEVTGSIPVRSTNHEIFRKNLRQRRTHYNARMSSPLQAPARVRW